MTPGTDGQTLDGISKNNIGKIAAELTNETFQFKPFRKNLDTQSQRQIETTWNPITYGKNSAKGDVSPTRTNL